jgi:hypothetical protein
MRLINTKTGCLEEFIGDDVPRYAILSHTWGKEEISLQEFQRMMDPDLANDGKTRAVKEKKGFIKVLRFVELAASKGIPYAWADTCCIDKTSSADLTESINSMYRWYKNSVMCFAYLADVASSKWPVRHHKDSEVGKSRWFTRGWTLQELLAPYVVEFYNQSWIFLGEKRRELQDIENITGISHKILEANDLSSANVAQKFSWAAKRLTTRKEDMAYCLLGIFDINMPLLYGEGEKAFLRLQEKIAETSTDHSLFAWGIQESGTRREEPRPEKENWLHRSIFACSPHDFVQCGGMESIICVHPDAWTQTNRGLHARFPIISTEAAKILLVEDHKIPDYIDDIDSLAILNCGRRYDRYVHLDYVIGIWITMIDPRDDEKDGFLRVSGYIAILDAGRVFYHLNRSPDQFPKRDLWMATSQTVKVSPRHFSNRLGGFLITCEHIWPKFHALYDSQAKARSPRYDAEQWTPHLSLTLSGGLVGVLTFRINMVNGGESEEEFAIVFGYPPSVKKPFAAIVRDFDHELPLNYDLQRHAPFEMDESRDDWATEYTYDGDRWTHYIEVCLTTILRDDMIFTELRVKDVPEGVLII